MMKTRLIFLLAAALWLPAHAQQKQWDDLSPQEKSRQMSDRALNAANDWKRRHDAAPPKAGPTLEAMKQQQSVDPGEIAGRYEEFRKATLPRALDLMVFVSSSMPTDTLKALGEQIAKAGGVMVFRGIKDGVQPGNWDKWMKYLHPIAKTGVTINIDPDLFKEHRVQAVPHFVIASRPEGCLAVNRDQCVIATKSVAGDVSLDYALERLEDDTPVGRLATSFLKKLKN